MNLIYKIFHKKIKTQELKRFLVIGLGSNIINFSVYYILIIFGLNLSLCSFTGYFAGVIFAYHFGRVWIFGQKFKVTPRSIILFALVYTLGSIFMTLIINFLVLKINFGYKLSWLFGAGAAAINNFLGMKFLAFRRKMI